jgi:hypothetical protein
MTLIQIWRQNKASIKALLGGANEMVFYSNKKGI